VTKDKRVGAIILAGGRSERLGRAKQLLPWNGRTLVEAVVEEVCRAERLAEVLLVLRRDVAEALGKRAGERLGCARIVFPDETGEGCAASYRSGLAALEESELDAVVILLADQPGVRVETIERVIAGWESSGAAIAVVRYRGIRWSSIVRSLRNCDNCGVRRRRGNWWIGIVSACAWWRSRSQCRGTSTRGRTTRRADGEGPDALLTTYPL